MKTAGILDGLLHLVYPHNCEGCGSDRIVRNQFLCARCMSQLPETGFFRAPGNPAERAFYGRCRVEHAGACFYFTKHSLLQHILVQLKYRGNKDAGYFLGRMMGYALSACERFDGADLIIPLPLNPKKEFVRGYNQAEVIAHGISETWRRPVVCDAVVRKRFTETQTHQNRVGRWLNMQHVFEITDAAAITGKHVLLVDDVITTGATLEACGSVILQVPGTRLSIATAAYTV